MDIQYISIRQFICQSVLEKIQNSKLSLMLNHEVSSKDFNLHIGNVCIVIVPMRQILRMKSKCSYTVPVQTNNWLYLYRWKMLTDLIQCYETIGLIWSFPLHEDLLFIGCILQGLHWHWGRNCKDRENQNQYKTSAFHFTFWMKVNRTK